MLIKKELYYINGELVKIFFILCILGGSLGEILGIYTFRHKTKHLKFTLGFPLILIIQLLIFLYLKTKL